jgi:acid phosphatase type 7
MMRPETAPPAPKACSVTVSNQAFDLTFVADEDSYIRANPSNKNYGGNTSLWVMKDTYEILIKFNISGISADQVAGAKLRLYNSNSSDHGGNVHVVDDNWSEMTVTWNNAPQANLGPVASLGAVKSNTWVEVDLTDALVTSLEANDYTISLRVVSTSTDSAGYRSRETTGYAPQLVVTTR